VIDLGSINSLCPGAGAAPVHERLTLEAWELYYPGRQLGWHMYNPYGLEKNHRAKILARVDYAIVGVKTAENLESKQREVGWGVQATFSPASRAVMGVRVGRGLGAVPYGPYVLLHRP
jgi:hypothetical protein